MNQTIELAHNTFWITAAKLTEYGYGLLAELPEEEKWDMISKLRQHSFNVSNNMAQAIGSYDPRDRSYYFQLAIRDLFALNNSLRMAKRIYHVSIEPQIMLDLEDLIKKASDEATKSREDIQNYLKMYDKSDTKAEA